MWVCVLFYPHLRYFAFIIFCCKRKQRIRKYLIKTGTLKTGIHYSFIKFISHFIFNWRVLSPFVASSFKHLRSLWLDWASFRVFSWLHWIKFVVSDRFIIIINGLKSILSCSFSFWVTPKVFLTYLKIFYTCNTFDSAILTWVFL